MSSAISPVRKSADWLRAPMLSTSVRIVAASSLSKIAVTALAAAPSR
jgi:hypothetical protein